MKPFRLCVEVTNVCLVLSLLLHYSTSSSEQTENSEHNPCEPNPCEFGGKCQVDRLTKDFLCYCRYPYGGRTCNKINPAEQRWRQSWKAGVHRGKSPISGQPLMASHHEFSSSHVAVQSSHSPFGGLLGRLLPPSLHNFFPGHRDFSRQKNELHLSRVALLRPVIAEGESASPINDLAWPHRNNAFLRYMALFGRLWQRMSTGPLVQINYPTINQGMPISNHLSSKTKKVFNSHEELSNNDDNEMSNNDSVEDLTEKDDHLANEDKDSAEKDDHSANEDKDSTEKDDHLANEVKDSTDNDLADNDDNDDLANNDANNDLTNDHQRVAHSKLTNSDDEITKDDDNLTSSDHKLDFTNDKLALGSDRLPSSKVIANTDAESTNDDDDDADQLPGELTPDPCESSPCGYGGTCYSDLTTQSYLCDCPFPSGGRSCELDLDQCCDCARLEDLVIFVFKNESLTWDDAYDACHAMGYEMLMPKTAAIFNFTRDYLGELDHRDFSDHGYWIGLNRTSSDTDVWNWVDGTKLGNGYNQWFDQQFGDSLCAGMPNDPAFNWDWVATDCDADPTDPSFSSFYICQKSYSFYNS